MVTQGALGCWSLAEWFSLKASYAVAVRWQGSWLSEGSSGCLKFHPRQLLHTSFQDSNETDETTGFWVGKLPSSLLPSQGYSGFPHSLVAQHGQTFYMIAGFSQSMCSKKPRQSCKVFYDPASELTQGHFHRLLLVTQASPDSARRGCTQQHKCQEVQSIWKLSLNIG